MPEYGHQPPLASSLVIADASCLIALSRIQQLPLLEKLYGRITIPPAVTEEVAASTDKRRIPLEQFSWIEIKPLGQPLGARMLFPTLGQGEAESIALAAELNADLVILDETAARNIAKMLDLKFTGTLGVLLKAKKRGFIPRIKPLLNEIIRAEFRLSHPLYAWILDLADET